MYLCFPEVDKLKKEYDKKTKMIFYVSFIPMMGLAVFACLIFGVLMALTINAYVSATVSTEVTKLSEKLNVMTEPDRTNVLNIATFAAMENTKDYMDKAMSLYEKTEGAAASYHYAPVAQFSPDGMFFSISNGLGSTVPENFDWSTKEWFKGSSANPKEFYYSEPYANAGLGKITFTYSKAALDNMNRVIGISCADMYIDDLNKIIDEFKISKKGKIYLIHKDGKFLTNEDSSKVLKENFFETEKLKMTAKEAFKQDYFSSVVSSKYLAYSRVGDFPFYIVAIGPMSDFAGTFLYMMFGIIAGLVVIAFFLAIRNTKFITSFQNKEKELGGKLFVNTQNLSVAAKETAATSQDQSAAVKEIVATMEDSNNLSENISAKITDVAEVAKKTTCDVSDGAQALAINVQKLKEIYTANQETITGIKSLGEKIENIWDIVTLINSVADSAKIIAFNAELEAASAGEAGKNFHIVATEIRRLADGIIDGTKEIKERINEIQQSSDNLILASESGTEKINEGCESAEELERKFNSIKTAAEVTENSATDITSIIQQQTAASGQILITLKQIAAGVENFSAATESISSSAENLKAIAEELNSEVNEDSSSDD